MIDGSGPSSAATASIYGSRRSSGRRSVCAVSAFVRSHSRRSSYGAGRETSHVRISLKPASRRRAAVSSGETKFHGPAQPPRCCGERRPLADRPRRSEQLGRVAGPAALRDEAPAACAGRRAGSRTGARGLRSSGTPPSRALRRHACRRGRAIRGPARAARRPRPVAALRRRSSPQSRRRRSRGPAAAAPVGPR